MNRTTTNSDGIPAFPENLTVLLISDTHGKIPESLSSLWEGIDLILHAGDIDTEMVLDRLESVARVRAVRGNMDRGSWASRFSTFDMCWIGSNLVYGIHDLNRMDLDPKAAGIRILFHGHTHLPMMEQRDGVWFLNPGSASYPRNQSAPSVMRIVFTPSDIRPELIRIG